MSYKVIYPFRDLQDVGKTFPNGRVYARGDVYPATKRKVNEDRAKELMGNKNAIGKKLIEEVVEEVEKDEVE